MKNILIAPDSFKGTLSAEQVCNIIGKAFEDEIGDVNTKKLPLADGGEGLCDCMKQICGGKTLSAEVSGVFGKKMQAEYLILPDNTAVIEMAACAGLPLAGSDKNPELATTKGVGELISHAISNGAKSILLGLGGSATNDCGIGMASALGYEFLDAVGNILEPIGKNLSKINKIKCPENKIPVPVFCACDVENPLYGESGAAYVFARQKGADDEMIARLDEGLKNISEVIKRDLGKDISSLEGAGAAGGLGAGAVVFLYAKLQKGIELILDKSGFDNLLTDADLVITGEGRLDNQSVQGKVISGVAKRAVKKGVKVITICGCKGDGAEKALEIGVSEMYFSCNEPKPFEEILKTCEMDLYNAARCAAIKYRQTN